MNMIQGILRMPLRKCKNSRGSAAVEIGLTMLPFLIAFFGVIEFGWYFFQQHTLQSAAREGIRVGLLGVKLVDENGDVIDRKASIIQAINDKAGGFIEIQPGDIKINPLNAAPGAPDSAGTPGELMRVQVLYTHEFFSPLIGGFFGDDGKIQMQAQGTYRNEDFVSS